MTAGETRPSGYAGEADRYLAAAADGISLSWINTKPTADPVRKALALLGIGQALLALQDTLDDRLADVADAVTDAGSQVSEVLDPPHELPACGRWPQWRQRRHRVSGGPGTVIANAPTGVLVLTSDQVATILRALADAVEWRSIPARDGRCGCSEYPDGVRCPAHAGDEQLAADYRALRERLGGDAS